MQVAIAKSREWLKLSEIFFTLRDSAKDFALPRRLIFGAPRVLLRISTSVSAVKMPLPVALKNASFAANRAA